mgnify:CR=1 FL=1
MFKKLYHIARRECGIMRKNPIYLFCMVIFPIVVVIFFTTLMQGGVPTDMPVGIVDQDNSHTSRQLVHKLDAFQTTKVVAHYENIAEARHAIQKNEIYAFLVIPNGTEAGLMASRQPGASPPAEDFLLLQQRFAGSRLPALPGSEDHFHPGRRSSRYGEAVGTGKDEQ